MFKVHITNTKHITIANNRIPPRDSTSTHYKTVDTNIQHCIQHITNSIRTNTPGQIPRGQIPPEQIPPDICPGHIPPDNSPPGIYSKKVIKYMNIKENFLKN